MCRRKISLGKVSGLVGYMTVGFPCTVDRCIQGVKLALAFPNDDARATRSVVLNLGLRLMDLSKFGARRAASSDPTS